MSTFSKFLDHTTLATMLTFAGWQRDFTESDRNAMEEGLDVLRTAMCQPVGLSASSRVEGVVSESEFDRAVMQVLASAMVMWLSGRLDDVEVGR